jgi:hypothetical protein
LEVAELSTMLNVYIFATLAEHRSPWIAEDTDHIGKAIIPPNESSLWILRKLCILMWPLAQFILNNSHFRRWTSGIITLGVGGNVWIHFGQTLSALLGLRNEVS